MKIYLSFRLFRSWLLQHSCSDRRAGKRLHPERNRIVIFLAMLCLIAAGWVLLTFLRGLYALGKLDSTVVTLRILANAEKEFAEVHPAQGYTCNLSELSETIWVKSEARKSLMQTGQ